MSCTYRGLKSDSLPSAGNADRICVIIIIHNTLQSKIIGTLYFFLVQLHARKIMHKDVNILAHVFLVRGSLLCHTTCLGAVVAQGLIHIGRLIAWATKLPLLVP